MWREGTNCGQSGAGGGGEEEREADE